MREEFFAEYVRLSGFSKIFDAQTKADLKCSGRAAPVHQMPFSLVTLFFLPEKSFFYSTRVRKICEY